MDGLPSEDLNLKKNNIYIYGKILGTRTGFFVAKSWKDVHAEFAIQEDLFITPPLLHTLISFKSIHKTMITGMVHQSVHVTTFNVLFIEIIGGYV